jgi:hypothetical protein
MIDRLRLGVGIEPTGAKRYAFHAVAHNANLAGMANPVPVTLAIGDDGGTTAVKINTNGLIARCQVAFWRVSGASNNSSPGGLCFRCDQPMTSVEDLVSRTIIASNCR